MLTEQGSERDTSKYRVGGLRVVSVTEALSLSGHSDFSRVDPDVLRHAQWRGTSVHRITADLDMGRDPGPIDAELVPYVDAYLTWRHDTGFKPELREHVVVSANHRYAGTTDIVGLLNDFDSLIDIKCTATLTAATGLQTAGYAIALERPHIKRFALQLKPNGRYKLEPYRKQSDLLNWLAALRNAQFRIENERIHLDHMENAA
jgi:hypothetical protein